MQKTQLLAGAAVLALLSGQAAKAGSLYVFGDSLSDDGNLYKLIGEPAPPYYMGRFSNGPVWVEYLPGLTGLRFTSANDYAVGGAFTGDLSYGGTDYGTNLDNPALPGITTEIAQFTATGQHFSSADVVSLWGGANNYFEYATIAEGDPGAATAIVTAGVTSTLTQLTADTTALINLGARTLLVPNIPNLGATPDYNTTLQGTELGDAFSTAHDTALPVFMAGLHSQTGANIIVLNEQQLLTDVIAHPGTYGFTNVTDACTATPACVGGSTATQNTYLFWDGVHPTTHAQDIIAQYAAASLQALEGLTIPAQLGSTGAQDFANQLDNRMEALLNGASGFAYSVNGDSGGTATPDQALSLFVSAGGDFGSGNKSANTLGYTYTNGIAALGLDYRFSPNFIGGLALGYGNDHANVKSGGTVTNTALNAGVYGLFTQGNAYLKVSASYGDNWYETRRPGVLPGNVTAKPQGATYTGYAEGGYTLGLEDGISLTPAIGLGYNNTSLQSYTESGDALLTQQVDGQGFQQLITTLGATAATSLQLAGVQVQPYLSAAAQIRLSGKEGSFTSAFTDEPLVPLTNTYAPQPTAWALFGAGATASLTPNISASAQLAATAFKSNGNDVQVSGAVSWTF
jgi:outer membrane lipase/esterase